MEFIINYWIEFAFGILISIGTYLLRYLQKMKKEALTTKKGVILILRIHIIDLYEQIKEAEKIGVNCKREFDELYEAYHILIDKDDVVSDIMDAVSKFKIE